MIPPLRRVIGFLFYVPPEAVEELGIAFGHYYSGNMDEETEGDHIEGMEPDTESSTNGAVEYSYGPGHSSHEDLFG
jgi:hypothetical protein